MDCDLVESIHVYAENANSWLTACLGTKMTDASWAIPGSSRDSLRLDTGVALVGLGISLLLMPLPLFTDEILITIVPIAGAVSSATYLLARRLTRQPSHLEIDRYGSTTARMLETGIILGCGGLALLAGVHGYRSLPFYGLSSVLGSAILFQIVFVEVSELRPKFVLAELLGLLLLVQYTALLTTPGFVGVDTWTHITQFAHSISEAGALDAISASKYSAAPLYHLLVVSAAKAFGSSLRTAMFGTVALLMATSTLLLYHTGRYLFNVRWALLTAALFTMSDYLFRWSIDVIPNSMGVVYFIAVVYAVIKLHYTEARAPVYVLALFFSFTVVLTHQVSTFIVLTFLGAGVIAKALTDHTTSLTGFIGRRTPNPSSVNTDALFVATGVFAVINWSYTPYGSRTFIERMLLLISNDVSEAGFLNLRDSSQQALSIPESLLNSTPFIVRFLDSLGFAILLSVTILGILVLLQMDSLSQLAVTFVGAVGIMLVFTLGLPLFGINVFIPDRWFAFIYALMAIVGVFGLRYITRQIRPTSVVVGLVVLILVFPGSMFVAQKSTMERPVFDESYPRYSYSESELAAAESIAAINPDSSEKIVTDHPYRTVFANWLGAESETIHFNETDGTLENTSVIYREYQSTGTPVVAVEGVAIKSQFSYERVCPANRSVVYSNGVVQYCRKLPP